MDPDIKTADEYKADLSAQHLKFEAELAEQRQLLQDELNSRLHSQQLQHEQQRQQQQQQQHEQHQKQHEQHQAEINQLKKTVQLLKEQHTRDIEQLVNVSSPGQEQEAVLRDSADSQATQAAELAPVVEDAASLRPPFKEPL
jgi:hypothetical protein